MEIDPGVDKKSVAFVENIEAVPGRVDFRTKLRDEMNTVDDVIERYYLRAYLTALFCVSYCVHLRR